MASSEAPVPSGKVHLTKTPAGVHHRGHGPATKALQELSLDPTGSCCAPRPAQELAALPRAPQPLQVAAERSLSFI